MPAARRRPPHPPSSPRKPSPGRASLIPRSQKWPDGANPETTISANSCSKIRVTRRAAPAGNGTGWFRRGFFYRTSRRCSRRRRGRRSLLDRGMLRSSIVRLVEFCSRFAWPVVLLGLALSTFCGIYAAQHFAVETDVKALFPRDLPWTRRAYDYLKEFPEHGILVVVNAPTP